MTRKLVSSGSPFEPRIGFSRAVRFTLYRGGGVDSRLGTRWRAVSDTVMGGVSQGRLGPAEVAGRACLHLTGQVSLERNGGFLQASLDLARDGVLDASGYTGIELDVYGNGETYNVHLRTADTVRVWQSYRASFDALPCWRSVRLPFSAFRPYRLEAPLDVARLRRLGLVAIGRAFRADLCLGRLVLYGGRGQAASVLDKHTV